MSFNSPMQNVYNVIRQKKSVKAKNNENRKEKKTQPRSGLITLQTINYLLQGNARKKCSTMLKDEFGEHKEKEEETETERERRLSG